MSHTGLRKIIYYLRYKIGLTPFCVSGPYFILIHTIALFLSQVFNFPINILSMVMIWPNTAMNINQRYSIHCVGERRVS